MISQTKRTDSKPKPASKHKCFQAYHRESAHCIKAQYLHHLRWRLQHILGKLDSVWVLGLSSRGDMGHRNGECGELEDCKLAPFVPGIVLQCISFY